MKPPLREIVRLFAQPFIDAVLSPLALEVAIKEARAAEALKRQREDALARILALTDLITRADGLAAYLESIERQVSQNLSHNPPKFDMSQNSPSIPVGPDAPGQED